MNGYLIWNVFNTVIGLLLLGYVLTIAVTSTSRLFGQLEVFFIAVVGTLALVIGFHNVMKEAGR